VVGIGEQRAFTAIGRAAIAVRVAGQADRAADSVGAGRRAVRRNRADVPAIAAVPDVVGQVDRTAGDRARGAAGGVARIAGEAALALDAGGGGVGASGADAAAGAAVVQVGREVLADLGAAGTAQATGIGRAGQAGVAALTVRGAAAGLTVAAAGARSGG